MAFFRFSSNNTTYENNLAQHNKHNFEEIDHSFRKCKNLLRITVIAEK